MQLDSGILVAPELRFKQSFMIRTQGAENWMKSIPASPELRLKQRLAEESDGNLITASSPGLQITFSYPKLQQERYFKITRPGAANGSAHNYISASQPGLHISSSPKVVRLNRVAR